MAIAIQNNNHKILWDYNNRETISIILYRLQKGVNGMFSTAISCYEDFDMCKHSTKLIFL